MRSLKATALPTSMLTRIKLGQFRCFDDFETEFHPSLNLIIGPNAAGKTSLLEAACVLLRLQSPRTSKLADVIRHDARGFFVDGYHDSAHLQFYYSPRRKKLALDSVEQSSALEYLKFGKVVWFSNTDIALVRGTSDVRRRFMDFLAVQLHPAYRSALRNYERALRARNLLLKSNIPRWREIQAFNEPLLNAGNLLMDARKSFVTALRPLAQLTHGAISASRETLDAKYVPSCGNDFAAALESARGEDLRLRQTTMGPHRDDLQLTLSNAPATLGSEGQQRTLAISLRLAAARLIEADTGTPPLLLLDDIFGELDLARRTALLRELPATSQQIITTTELDWLPQGLSANILRLPPRPDLT